MAKSNQRKGKIEAMQGQNRSYARAKSGQCNDENLAMYKKKLFYAQ